MTILSTLKRALLGAVAVSAVTATAHADMDMSGKTVEWIIPFSESGGSEENVDADGMTIFGSSGSTQFPYLLGDPRVRYEYNDWNVVLTV